MRWKGGFVGRAHSTLKRSLLMHFRMMPFFVLCFFSITFSTGCMIGNDFPPPPSHFGYGAKRVPSNPPNQNCKEVQTCYVDSKGRKTCDKPIQKCEPGNNSTPPTPQTPPTCHSDKQCKAQAEAWKKKREAEQKAWDKKRRAEEEAWKKRRDAEAEAWKKKREAEQKGWDNKNGSGGQSGSDNPDGGPGDTKKDCEDKECKDGKCPLP